MKKRREAARWCCVVLTLVVSPYAPYAAKAGFATAWDSSGYAQRHLGTANALAMIEPRAYVMAEENGNPKTATAAPKNGSTLPTSATPNRAGNPDVTARLIKTEASGSTICAFRVTATRIPAESLILVTFTPDPTGAVSAPFPGRDAFAIPGLPVAASFAPPGGVWDIPLEDFRPSIAPSFEELSQTVPGWTLSVFVVKRVFVQGSAPSLKPRQPQPIGPQDVDKGLCMLGGSSELAAFRGKRSFTLHEIPDMPEGTRFSLEQKDVVCSDSIHYDSGFKPQPPKPQQPENEDVRGK